MKPRVLVLYGHGINCDEGTARAFKDAGADATRALMRQLSDGRIKLSDYDILALPGGFSYGDDIQSGRIMAVELKYGLGDQLQEFVRAKKPVVGICNGYQMMTALGLEPGLDNEYTTHRATLMANEAGRFRNDWVKLELNEDSPCICTRGLGRYIELPIRHGEGDFFAPEDVLDRMEAQQQIVARYVGPNGERNPGFPHNPNGAMRDIAGTCDPSGLLTGLMPHPECAREVHNHPRWTRDRRAAEENAEKARLFFRNAVAYVEG